ncbi:MerR family transcriptional regulator [Psychrobacillus lasiicapitis]|uniref:MerR family transcriptional regulator n=1 Tax=Psychrobacillus lasiicapitis TaxID=1636719 RepID=UPI0014775235|nr:MerR family transcriptional regulator [Psychrobacillus lasiicapitis]GGA27432.1 MerR family transcriptional regulator [Psychrobacillus lasiicapitis]
MYSIGNLAKLSNSTVRTLRYYDEIGLLTPSQLSEGGHRYYEEQDVIKLQYIKILKEIGFSLITIREMLEHQHLSHKDALTMQLKVLEIEKERIEEQSRSIRYLLQLSEFEELANWKDVFDRIPMNPSSTNTEVYERIWKNYFSKEEVQLFKDLPKIGDNDETIQVYISLINDIRQNLNIDITSSKAQDLASRYIELLEKDFKGDFQLAEKVWNKQKEVKDGLGFYQFDPAIVDFIEKAIVHYFTVNAKGQ